MQRRPFDTITVLAILVTLFVLIAPGCGDEDPVDIGKQKYDPPVQPLARVTTGAGYATASPDGEWLAYSDVTGQLEKIHVDGGPAVSLGVSGWEAAWSPTGNVIAYVFAGSIYTVPAAGGDGTLLYDDADCSHPSWAPAGDKIVVQDQHDKLRVIAYPFGILMGVISCEDPVDSGCESEGPTWSGPGDWIAFEDGVEIMRVSALGGTAQTVVGGLNDVSDPAYSPDGKWVAFTMDNDGQDTGNNIWIADARGYTHGLHQITTGATVKFRPCWSPDSKVIYFDDYGVYDPITGYEHDSEIWKIGVKTD